MECGGSGSLHKRVTKWTWSKMLQFHFISNTSILCAYIAMNVGRIAALSLRDFLKMIFQDAWGDDPGIPVDCQVKLTHFFVET
jgi:hypothetical protein